jgi:selenocysteine lyase/cysteine desulfurase
MAPDQAIPGQPMMSSRRDAFDLAPGEVYLNGGANSPLPSRARAALDEAWAMQAHPSRIPFEAFFSFADAIRERVGRALGLPANEVSVTTSTSFGIMLVAQGIRWQPGDRLLLGPDEFPSNAYPWFALEERGVRIERIGSAGRPLTAADVQAACDAGGRVRALSVAAVHYPTGDVHPLSEVAEVLHAHGAVLIVDGSQAAGAVAIDWAASGVDAVAISGYKWLFGPYGTGILWVRPALRDELTNVNGNWMAVDRSQDLGRLMADYPREYQRHGRLFDAGEVASYFNLSTFRAGLDLLLEVGVDRAEAHHRALQDRVVDALAGGPLRPVTSLDAPHRSPMLMLAAGNGLDFQRLNDALSAQQISISLRVGRMRVSPGIWNDEADVDRFVAAVRAYG